MCIYLNPVSSVPKGIQEARGYTPNLPTNIVDVRGFDSSTI